MNRSKVWAVLLVGIAGLAVWLAASGGASPLLPEADLGEETQGATPSVPVWDLKREADGGQGGRDVGQVDAPLPMDMAGPLPSNLGEVAASGPERLTTLRGQVVRVLDRGYQPVPNARVWHEADRGWWIAGGTVSAETRSDQDGEFELTVDAARAGRSSVLQAEAEGMGPEQLLLLDAAGFLDQDGQHRPQIDGVQLTVGPLGKVLGSVRTEEGEPVAGVDALLMSRSLAIHHRPGPVPGSSYRKSRFPKVTSDEAGRFTIVACQGDRWSIQCSKERQSTSVLVGPVGSEPVEVEVLWPPEQAERKNSHLLTGLVVDPRGRPVPGARVFSHREETVADEAGHFRMEWNAMDFGDPELIAAVAEGFAPGTLFLDVPVPKTLEQVVITLHQPLSMEGVLLGSDGKPMHGELVKLQGEEEWPEGGFDTTVRFKAGLALGARTDAEGRFRFEGLRRRPYRLVCDDGQARERAELVAMAGTGGLVMRMGEILGPASEFQVAVTDQMTGAPIPGAKVNLMEKLPTFMGSISTVGVGSGVTGALGQVVIRTGFLEDGRARQATVTAAGYVSGESELTVYPQGAHRIDLPLYPARELRVRVLDGAGAPVASNPVQCVGPGGKPVSISLGGGSYSSAVQTGPDGRVTLDGLPAGNVRVQLMRTPPYTKREVQERLYWKPLLEVAVDLTADQVHEVTLVRTAGLRDPGPEPSGAGGK